MSAAAVAPASSNFRKPKPAGALLTTLRAVSSPVQPPPIDTNRAALLRKAQASVTPSVTKLSAHSVTLQGVVLSSFGKTNEFMKSFKGKETKASFSTRTYTVRLTNASKVAVEYANSKFVQSLPDGTGFRLLRSNFCTKVDVYTTMQRGLKAYRAEHQLPEPEQQDDADAAADPSKLSFYADLAQMPFAANPAFAFSDGATVQIEVHNGSEMATNALVKIEGFTIDLWAADPAKRKAAPDGSDADASAATAPSGPSEHAVVNPDTGFALRYTLRANLVTAVNTPYNSLPEGVRIRAFTDMKHQRWYSPMQEPAEQRKNNIFAVALGPDEPAAADNDAGDAAGSMTSACVYQRHLPGENCLTGPTDAATFTIERHIDGNERAVYPINFTATNWRSVSDAAEAEQLRSQYDACDRDGDAFLLTKTFGVKAMAWPNHTRLSGIANREAWTDTNTFYPLSAMATLRLSAKKNLTGSNTLDMDVVSMDFDMEAYLRTFGTPVTLAMAQKLLGGRDVATSIDLGSETNEAGKAPVAIVNTGNATRKDLDLLNATEFSGPLASYLDPANGWEAVALIVPVRADLNKSSDATRAKILEAVSAVQSAGSPAEGDAAVQTLLKTVSPNTALTEFGHHARDVRCMVWFMRRLETRFDAKILNTPYYQTLQSTAAPAQGVKRPLEQDLVSDRENADEIKLPEPEPQSESESMDMGEQPEKAARTTKKAATHVSKKKRV